MAGRPTKVTYRDGRDTLREVEYDLNEASRRITDSMVRDLNTTEEFAKAKSAASAVYKKLWRLEKDEKSRRFRHREDLLDTTLVKRADHSIFQSQEGNLAVQDPSVDCK